MITNIYEIPLAAENQKFHITLSGIDYTFSLRWNFRASQWILNIGDTAELPIINGIPLVAGVNLLSGYKAHEIGGVGSNLFIRSFLKQAHLGQEQPLYNDLGSNTRLYYGKNLPGNPEPLPSELPELEAVSLSAQMPL